VTNTEGGTAYPMVLADCRTELTRQQIAEGLSNPFVGDQGRAALQKELEILDQAAPSIRTKPGGKMYEVNINAPFEDFLDWDKPLSEQSERVQAAMQRLGLRLDPELRGEEAYAALRGIGRQRAPVQYTAAGASRALKEAGLPGIKYLDQGSRAQNVIDQRLQTLVTKHGGNIEAAVDDLGRGVYLPPKEKAKWRQSLIENYQPQTHNFVVFDDQLVSILRKYGLLPPIAAGALSQVARPQSTEMR